MTQSIFTEKDMRQKLYDVIERGYADDVPTEVIIDTIMVYARQLILRRWAITLQGIQVFTDPMQPRGISPFRRLKSADEHINRDLSDIAHELKQLTEKGQS